MDFHFHTLDRRQLQTLCKKNKIPANITNVAMADALSALPSVQGMEELSIDTPATPQLITTTACRTRSFKHESDDFLHPPTTIRTTHHSSARDAHHQHQPHPTSLNIINTTLDFNLVEEEQQDENDANIRNEKQNLSHYTPAAVPTSRQRAALTLKSQETKVQGTRRSARLAARNKQQENNTNDQISQTVLNMDLGQVMEINVKGSVDADVDSVAKSFGEVDLNEKSEEEANKSNIAAVVSDCSAAKDNIKFETGFNEVSKDGYGCKTENSIENGEELDINDVFATDDVQEILTDQSGDAFSIDNGVDLNMSKEELESKQDFGQSHGMDLFQTEAKNLIEDEIALDDEKDTNLEDLNPLRICNAVSQRDESADTEIEPKAEKQDAWIIKPAIEPKVEEDLENNKLAETLSAMELNTSNSKYELSWVEAAGFGLEPSMDIKEEMVKDLSGDPAVSVNNVTMEQLDGDYEVLEIQADPREEEDLKNNSSVEFSNKKQDATAVDQVVTTPKLSTGDTAALWSSPTVDSNENLSNFGVDGDYEVLEIQADPREEEDLKNNSSVEFSNRKQDATAVDQVVTTPMLSTGDTVWSSLTVDSNENLSNLGVEEVTDLTQLFDPTINYLSPVKVSSPTPGKTPLQKTVSSKTPTIGKRILMLVSDDKENIDNSGTRVITTTAKEKNEKKGGICMENSQKPCCDEKTSLRKLKKELKAKLEEKANNKNIKAGSITRPALQALPENPRVGNF